MGLIPFGPGHRRAAGGTEWLNIGENVPSGLFLAYSQKFLTPCLLNEVMVFHHGNNFSVGGGEQIRWESWS